MKNNHLFTFQHHHGTYSFICRNEDVEKINSFANEKKKDVWKWIKIMCDPTEFEKFRIELVNHLGTVDDFYGITNTTIYNPYY